MPIHIYEGKSGKLITTVLRLGKGPAGEQPVSILKRVVKKIREAWPEVEVLLRSDSYYSCPDVYEFCEKEEIKYVFGFKPFKPLKEKAKKLSKN